MPETLLKTKVPVFPHSIGTDQGRQLNAFIFYSAVGFESNSYDDHEFALSFLAVLKSSHSHASM